MSLDIHDQPSFYPFFITFTSGDPFPESFVADLSAWHVKKCDCCLLVSEGGPGKDKHLHFHSVGTWKTTNPSNVTRACKTLYKKHKIEWTKNCVRVKTVPELIGMFHYLLKEVSDSDVPLLLMGWKMSWIREKLKANLKKMPHTMLLKDEYFLTPKTATAMLLKYADVHSLRITCIEAFKSLIKRMMIDKYRFANVRWKILYVEVSIAHGNSGPLDDFLESELFGMR